MQEEHKAMVNQRWLTVAGALAVGVLLAAGDAARAQPGIPPVPPPVPAQEGVEPLPRGPVHEAFAEPVDTAPRAPLVVPKQPPGPLEELPPDQKPEGANVQWVPGCWNWDDDRTDFIWVSGFWRVPPPGRQWVPGRWAQAGASWQWVPGFWTGAQQTQVQYLPPPPDPVAAAAVPAPNPDSVYVPGCWVYRESRYLWRPAYWMEPRPGWVWVPAHYVWTPVGAVFVDGYWDFDLAQRGLLFAPVYVERRYWSRPGWFFRPYFAVRCESLYGALFVRPGYRHYYFGDYFDPVYARRGYVAWVDFQIGRGGYDPLYGYYRWSHRANPRWEADLRGLYAARVAGTVPRPPRTLVQQTTLVQKGGSVTTVNSITVLAPMTHVNQTGVRLQRITRDHQLEEQQAARRTYELSRQRDHLEGRLLAQPTAPIKPAGTPHRLEFDVKVRPPVKGPDKGRVPPPPPKAPPPGPHHEPGKGGPPGK
jgi:hypothetical protein